MEPTEAVSPGIIPSRNDKRERKHTAQILPSGLTQNMMKKYVVYYREIMYLKNGKKQQREYFKVESHPRLKKPWVSSKSTKLSLLEKLNDANQVVTDLETAEPGSITMDISNEASMLVVDKECDCSVVERLNKELPKYTTLRVIKDTPTAITMSLIYDRKDNNNGFRWTSSNTFTLENTTINSAICNELKNLQTKLMDKYGIDLLYI
jgi:hypothetical protein